MQTPTALEQQIAELAAAIAADHEAAIVQVRVHQGSNAQVQVLAEHADPEQKILLDKCVEISRELGAELDVNDLMPGKYNLEVSSAGVERPLTQPSDFTRFAGRRAKLKLFAPIDGQKLFEGELVGEEDGHVVLKVSGTPIHFNPTAIASAHLTLSKDEWNKIFKQNQ